MDGYRTVKGTLSRVWAVVRRRPRMSVLALAVFVVFVVPVVPVVPSCGYHDKPIRAAMSPEYRYFLKSAMNTGGPYYWEIGDTFLVTVSIWLDLAEFGFGDVDRLTNAFEKTSFFMGLERYVRHNDGSLIESAGSWVGIVVAGAPYRIPDHVNALRDPVTGRFNMNSCAYIYATVTGQPAPPEFRD